MTFLTDAPLAQLDRALDYESSGQRFESSRARHFMQFEPLIRMEVEPGRRCVESSLRMHHFRRGPFAPVGKGFFSTRSTSKGISEAARMLSAKVSRPDENSSVLDGILDGKADCRVGSASGEWERRNPRSAVPSVLGALRAFPPGPSRSGPVWLLPQRSDGGWIRDSTWVREFPSGRHSGRGS
jgi:hypothetical protein